MTEDVTEDQPSKDVCSNCGRTIETMAFRGTGACSVNCRKEMDKDEPAGGQ